MKFVPTKRPRTYSIFSNIGRLFTPAFEPLERRALFSTFYVDVNAPGPSNGRSWDQAFQNIQDAIAVSIAGDEIHVADGDYSSTGESRIQLKTGVALLGGYAGSGVPNPEMRNPSTQVSLISGDSHVAGLDGVIRATSVGTSARLDGFAIRSGGFNGLSLLISGGSPTIQDCVFTGGMGIYNLNSNPTIAGCTFAGCDGNGGGAITNADSGPNISNSSFINCFGNTGGAILSYASEEAEPALMSIAGCTFTGNRAAHRGQAISGGRMTITDSTFDHNGSTDEFGGAIYGASLTLLRCTFTENIAEGGGAIAFSSVVADNCRFTRNSAIDWGGAIYSDASNELRITNSIFEGNSAYYSGAIDASNSSVDLTNCVFSGNVARSGGHGGGVSLASATATITNCTFTRNSSGYVAGALYIQNTALQLNNSILFGDSADVDGNEIYTYPYGNSSLNFDHNYLNARNGDGSPFVRDANPGADAQFGTADDDYGDLRIFMDAQVVDAGVNARVPAGVTKDVAGAPRFVAVLNQSAVVDLGAYEYQPLRAVSGAYRYDAPRNAVTMTFSDDLNPSTLDASDLLLIDLATYEPVPGLPAPTLSYSSETRTATWTYPVTLPDGNYRAEIFVGSVEGMSRNPLQTDFTFDFFVLAGDANRDRTVDSLDLAILASNWQLAGRTFAQGDFNYDGKVNIDDLNIISNSWRHTLPPPQQAVSVAFNRSVTKRSAVRVVGLVV